MMIADAPQVTILLATHNGAEWLEEQLLCLANQESVSVKVVVSDDQSKDETVNILNRYKSLPLACLPEKRERFRSANKNFLRLIQDADIGDSSYIALSDQDDVWYPDKLKRAIEQLRIHGAAAYSSNIEAFWPDRSHKLIKKAHPQKRWDHLFGSPGPGCTFVLTKDVFVELKAWATSNDDLLKQAWVHDWWIYAFVRSSGHKWLIDDSVKMRYRQHISNEIGANKGWGAIKKRYAIIKEGRYLAEVLLISSLVDCNPSWLKHLKRLNFSDRLFLMLKSYAFRRSPYDVIALFLIFMVAPKPNFEGDS